MVQNWMLWGFFVSRPTLAGELKDRDTVIAFSMLDFKSGPKPLSLSERTAAVTAAVSVCRPPYENVCLEGRLILRLKRLSSADVDEPVLAAAWAELTRIGWFPKASPGYSRAGVPVAGLAILFRKPNNREHMLLAYRTAEIGNDVYAYSEALFQTSGSGPTLSKQVHFYLDIAGMEGLEWPILWPLNVILLLTFWRMASGARIMVTLLKRQPSGR